MTSPTPDPVTDGLQMLLATQPGAALLPLLTPEGRQAVIVAALAAHAQQIELLEVQMAATDDKLAELSTHLDNVTGDVQWLKDELVRVQGEIDAQDPALAAKLQPLVDRAKALADSTPDQPAPPTP